ncbi:hypothetical protein [Rhodoblastus sp.]|uniref:hypothetical protein n=1 Tax=Rhodoblastus sp. TaxID=1962975 RepID=UPI003F9907CC
MTISEEEAKAKRRVEEAKKALKGVRLDEKKKRRNQDARGKILVGGYILAFVKAGDNSMGTLLDKMIENTVREEDRAAIKGALESTKAKSTAQKGESAHDGE